MNKKWEMGEVKIDKVHFWPFVLSPWEKQKLDEDGKLIWWWLDIKTLYYNIRWWLYKKFVIDPELARLGPFHFHYWRRALTWEEMEYINEISKHLDLRYPFGVEKSEDD